MTQDTPYLLFVVLMSAAFGLLAVRLGRVEKQLVALLRRQAHNQAETKEVASEEIEIPPAVNATAEKNLLEVDTNDPVEEATRVMLREDFAKFTPGDDEKTIRRTPRQSY